MLSPQPVEPRLIARASSETASAWLQKLPMLSQPPDRVGMPVTRFMARPSYPHPSQFWSACFQSKIMYSAFGLLWSPDS